MGTELNINNTTISRREFLQNTGLATAAITGGKLKAQSQGPINPETLHKLYPCNFDKPRITHPELFISLKESNETFYPNEILAPAIDESDAWYKSFRGLVLPQTDIAKVKNDFQGQEEDAKVVLLFAAAVGLDAKTLTYKTPTDTTNSLETCLGQLSQADIDCLKEIINSINKLPFEKSVDKQGMLRLFVAMGLYRQPNLCRSLKQGRDPRAILIESYGLMKQPNIATWKAGPRPEHYEGIFYPWQAFDAIIHNYNRSMYGRKNPFSNAELVKLHRRFIEARVHNKIDKKYIVFDLYGKPATGRARSTECHPWEYGDTNGPDNTRVSIKGEPSLEDPRSGKFGIMVNDVFANLVARLTGSPSHRTGFSKGWWQMTPLVGFNCSLPGKPPTISKPPPPVPGKCLPVPTGYLTGGNHGLFPFAKIVELQGCKNDPSCFLSAISYAQRSKNLFTPDTGIPDALIPQEDSQLISELGIPEALKQAVLIYAAVNLMDPITMQAEGSSRLDVWGTRGRPHNAVEYLNYIDEVVGLNKIDDFYRKTIPQVQYIPANQRLEVLRNHIWGTKNLQAGTLSKLFNKAAQSRYMKWRRDSGRVTVGILLRIYKWLNDNPAQVALLDHGLENLVARNPTNPWLSYIPYDHQEYQGGLRFIGCKQRILK